MSVRSIFTVTLCGIFMSGAVLAQDFMVFPNKDQTKEQQQKDETECAGWSKEQSGFDPAVPPQSSPPPQQQAPTTSVGRSAVRGAALGAVIGDSSEATGRGAAAGVLVGGMRRSDQKRQQQAEMDAWQAEQQRLYQEGLSKYNRAYAACL